MKTPVNLQYLAFAQGIFVHSCGKEDETPGKG
jgi:hypothetical protein